MPHLILNNVLNFFQRKDLNNQSLELFQVEVNVANHITMACAAMSVITDECDPDNLKPVDISEIIAVAGKADRILSILFKNVFEKLV